MPRGGSGDESFSANLCHSSAGIQSRLSSQVQTKQISRVLRAAREGMAVAQSVDESGNVLFCTLAGRKKSDDDDCVVHCKREREIVITV